MPSPIWLMYATESAEVVNPNAYPMLYYKPGRNKVFAMKVPEENRLMTYA
jgi:hypothetical protein